MLSIPATATFPNPDWEQIVLFATEGSVIDQVYIDTISIPAPAGVLAIAGMGLCWRRRRSRAPAAERRGEVPCTAGLAAERPPAPLPWGHHSVGLTRKVPAFSSAER